MHILIIAPSDKTYISKFLPNENYESLPNGYKGAIFIGTIIKELLGEGHTVTAITTTVAINNKYETLSYTHDNFTWVTVSARPHTIRMNGLKLGKIVDFFAYERREMLKAINKVKPDIIHAHWSYEFAGAAIKSGYPNLITVHDNAYLVFRFIKSLYRFGRLLMSETVLYKAKFVSTVSPYMLPYAKKRSKFVKVIPNPVPIKFNISEVQQFIKQRESSLSSPKVIMVNNGWDKRKNGKNALLAFKEIQHYYPKAELHLFGSGSEENGLAEMDASNLAITNLYFHGVVPNKTLFEALKNSHLFLHPALEESFGVVLIEAMSLGLPTIGGLNSGAVPWVISNNQLLVDVTKVSELTSKIQEILENKTKYAIISLDCYKNVVARFSSLEVTKQYLSYYKGILKSTNKKYKNP